MIKTLSVYCLLSILLLGCAQFEEGPYLSLRSKKNKVSQKWSYKSIEDLATGQIYTSMYEDWELDIQKSGKYIKKIEYLDNITTEEGNWEWDGATHLRFYHQENGSEVIDKYEVIRLSMDELWMKNSKEEIKLIIY